MYRNKLCLACLKYSNQPRSIGFKSAITASKLFPGFRRVRDYGFLHANAKRLLLQVQLALGVTLSGKPVKKRALCCGVCKGVVKVVQVFAQKIPLLFRRAVKTTLEVVAIPCNTHSVASTS